MLIILIFSVAVSSMLVVHPRNVFEKAVHWVKKEGKKAKKWSKGALNDIEQKFKSYGQQAVNAVEEIGEEVWNKLRKLASCADVVTNGARYAEAEAAYQSVKAASHALGPAAEKLGKLSSKAITEGVDITRISFKATTAAAFKDDKANVIDLEIQGTVFGKEIGGKDGIDVEVDLAKIKSAGAFAKEIFNEVF